MVCRKSQNVCFLCEGSFLLPPEPNKSVLICEIVQGLKNSNEFWWKIKPVSTDGELCSNKNQYHADLVFLCFAKVRRAWFPALEVQCVKFTGVHRQNITEIEYNVNKYVFINV